MEVSGPAQQPFGDFARRRKVERPGKEFRRSFVVAVQNRAEQLLLVAESGVEARPGNAESLGQVRNRRPFVTFSPEQQHRAVDGLARVELARPPDRDEATFFIQGS